MGLDIYKVSYSEGWRPSHNFINWCFDNLPGEEIPSLFYVPDGEMLDDLRESIKTKKPDLLSQFDELVKRFEGFSVYIG